MTREFDLCIAEPVVAVNHSISVAQLNLLFTAWVGTVYHRRVHSRPGRSHPLLASPAVEEDFVTT